MMVACHQLILKLGPFKESGTEKKIEKKMKMYATFMYQVQLIVPQLDNYVLVYVALRRFSITIP